MSNGSNNNNIGDEPGEFEQYRDLNESSFGKNPNDKSLLLASNADKNLSLNAEREETYVNEIDRMLIEVLGKDGLHKEKDIVRKYN